PDVRVPATALSPMRSRCRWKRRTSSWASSHGRETEEAVREWAAVAAAPQNPRIRFHRSLSRNRRGCRTFRTGKLGKLCYDATKAVSCPGPRSASAESASREPAGDSSCHSGLSRDNAGGSVERDAERSAFAKACAFLNYNPTAKWLSHIAAVGSGILYLVL